jgi:hypothetical protein
MSSSGSITHVPRYVTQVFQTAAAEIILKNQDVSHHYISSWIMAVEISFIKLLKC